MTRAVAALALAAAGALGCKPSAKPDPSGAATAAAAPLARGDASTAAPGEGAPKGEGGVRVVEPSADLDALSVVRTERLRAKAEGRVLVVYAGASWCEPCRRFKAEVGSGRLDDRLAGVTLLAFDVDHDADRLASAGYTFHYVPYVALPGADGRPVASEEAKGKGGDAWRVLVAALEGWRGAPAAR